LPKTREQIKHAPVSGDTWRQPRTSVLWFDPRKIKPLGNHILIELDEATDRTLLHVPDIARNKDIGTRIGTVLAVGPGKWHEKPGLTWELTKQVFKPTTLKRGDRVVIGHYSDWESWNCTADGHQSRGANIVLCQEADVRVVIEEVGVGDGKADHKRA
jgi:co-chaperonin GroES (HSP10)